MLSDAAQGDGTFGDQFYGFAHLIGKLIEELTDLGEVDADYVPVRLFAGSGQMR